MNDNLAQWLATSDMGQYVTQKEQAFFARVLADRLAESVVQMALPQWHLWSSAHCVRVGEDVHMSLDEMAWRGDSVDLLLMPHGLDCAASPARALAEAYRVLRSEGRLVLTGFNVASLWYLSNWFGTCLPSKPCCLTLPELKRQARALGFLIEQGRFMVYVPAVRSGAAIRRWHFMEYAGDRWWPHAAAVYGLVLVKREAGVHFLPEYEQAIMADEAGQMVLGAARTEAE